MKQRPYVGIVDVFPPRKPDTEPRGRCRLDVVAEESVPFGFAAHWLYVNGYGAVSALGLVDRFDRKRIALWLSPGTHRIQVRESLIALVGERRESNAVHVTAESLGQITLTLVDEADTLVLRHA